MPLTGLHLLLTYQCNLECDHCFVWGGPRQKGTMTLAHIREILRQARELGTIQSICYEGGEPFLYYPILLEGVRLAAQMGFQTGIVTNDYWAVGEEEAIAALKPFVGFLHKLTLSSDLFHFREKLSPQAQHARAAAEKLGIPVNLICVAQVEAIKANDHKPPPGEGAIMFRGRAAEKLAAKAPLHSWEQFTQCPYENLRAPSRLHVDPFGNLHLCQGLVLGNLWQTPLREICRRYDPEAHLVAGPLLAGGPAELARQNGISPAAGYADACHFCYETRRALRGRHPEILAPEQMYGAAVE